MGQPLFLAENFYNTQQFPAHVLVSGAPGGAAPGQEVFRVGTARRSILNGFRNADPSLTLSAQVNLGRIRSADCLVIDRNSDILGRDINVVCSSDALATVQPIFFGPVPSKVELGSSLNDTTHLIRTGEGAWILKFPETAASVFAVQVQATGGDSGRLGGVYLGKSFTPSHGGRLPFDDEDMWTDFGEVRRGVPDNDIRFGRTGAFGMMMSGEAEWNEARRSFRELFGKGFPMWIAPDSDMAERMWLGYNAPGSMAATFSERPQGRTVTIRADEYDGVLP